MIDYFQKSAAAAFAIVTGIFTFVPESIFANYSWLSLALLKRCKFFSNIDAQDINIIISRLICFGLVWVVAALFYAIFCYLRRWTTIKGQNYSIRIEYGDILKKKHCKKVINFDECYTTQVGDSTEDIKPTSLCGQYLLAHPNINMPQLIEAANVTPAPDKSKYQQKTRYIPGTIVPNGDDLLMAFARLDERGKGRFFSRDEYIDCLALLWKELEYHYAEKDVCVPILGAGITSFDGGTGASISQQDLLDMIIWSYKLSSHKIKAPHKLRIVCKKKMIVFPSITLTSN